MIGRNRLVPLLDLNLTLLVLLLHLLLLLHSCLH